jgi:hypothetical protein
MVELDITTYDRRQCSGLAMRGIIEGAIFWGMVKLMKVGAKGRLKEVIGENTIKQVLKRRLAGGTGFVGSKAAEAGEVWDNPLFSEGGDAAADAAGDAAGDAAADAAAEAGVELGSEDAVGAFIPVAGWIFDIGLTIFTVLTMDFAIQDVSMNYIAKGAQCSVLNNLDDKKDKCVSGYKGADNQCKPCDQIKNMRDQKDTTNYLKYYSGRYTDNEDRAHYRPERGYDPVVTGKLTNLSCGGRGEDEPVYAARRFPTGACVYENLKGTNSVNSINDQWDRTKLEDYRGDLLQRNTFLSSDPSTCRSALNPWDKNRYISPGPVTYDNSDDTKNWNWNYFNLKYIEEELPTETDCRGKSTDFTHKFFDISGSLDDEETQFGCAWSKVSAVGAKWEEFEGVFSSAFAEANAKLDGDVVNPYSPTALLSASDTPIHEYDGPNVCTAGFQLAGDYSTDRKGRRHQGVYDAVRNKDDDSQFISNHCCPAIIGAEDCPAYRKGPVTIKSSPGDFSGNKDGSEDTVDNCYIYRNPEFIPFASMNLIVGQNMVGQNDYDTSVTYNDSLNKDQENDFLNLRSGGIQCGPRDKQFASSPAVYENTTDNETFVKDNLVDVIRPISEGQPSTEWYATRFKLDNRYNYDWQEDSGATGYEHYLDPADYIPLNPHQRISETKFEEKNSVDTMYSIDRNTTINDIIARENGHPDRKKPLCDNITCNDLEKTRYMQTIYDGFCSKLDDTLNVRNTFQKFYRPVGIENQRDDITADEERKKYPDICCPPIPYSNKWSFVGCDAKGENSYFIDEIIQDYNNNIPTLIPLEGDHTAPRKRINPSQDVKLNLNQCIPSMEAKCDIKSEIIQQRFNSPSSPYSDMIKQLFYDKNKCQNLYDLHNLNKIFSGVVQNESSTNETKEKKLNLEQICGTDLPGAVGAPNCGAYIPHKFSDTHYVSSPRPTNTNDSQKSYWSYNRFAEGYVPTKGELNQLNYPAWTVNPEQGTHYDFTLEKPTNVYTECNPIPATTGIYDIEIYHKSIDWDKDEEKLRYIGDTPPTDTDGLFKIICKNYESSSTDYLYSIPVISSPIQSSGSYHYQVRCEKSDEKDSSVKNIDGQEKITPYIRFT